MWASVTRCAMALLLLNVGVSAGAWAQSAPAAGGSGPPEAAPGEPGFTTQLFGSSRSTLLGDMWGLRTALGRYGIDLSITETSEVLGNVTGGIQTGAAYDGLTTLTVGIDAEKAFGWVGGSFNISALQIHGRNLSADNLLSLQTASGIEAERATRFWELWYMQKFEESNMDLKIGQQSLDQEFIGSSFAGTFMNTMMGWPVVPSYDLYAGGPAYPLSSLGARIRFHPSHSVTVLAGVFNDNPPGGPFNDDSQTRDREKYGLQFNFNTGALFIGEIQFAVNQPVEGDLVTTGHTGLPGTYKLGFWFDTASFPNQRYDNTGLSLANPASTGIPQMDRRNFSIYGVADQVVWQPDPEEPQSLGVFARAMIAPGDRNLISFGLNLGMVLKAPLPGRDDDNFGIGFGLAKVGRNVSGLDRDTAFYTGAFTPIRSTEEFIEVTYQLQLAQWWLLQPDFQYVFRPGAGLANPNSPNQLIRNEAVFGLRTTITF